MSRRPRCAIPSSAEAVLDNQDLLTLILHRIPAKPLIQLKAVSRTWCALISHRQFASGHTLLHPPTKPSALLIRRSSTHFEFVSLSKTTSTTTNPLLDSIHLPCPKIRHSCNGLLLLRGSHPSPSSGRAYHVFNPTTNQLTTIPSPKFSAISLAFDPRKSPFYKVVGVSVTCRSLKQIQIHVYSSVTREWRALGPPFVASDTSSFNGGVSCYGAVHWNRFRFDIDQERLIPMPGFIPPVSYKYYNELSTSNGQLQLVETFQPWCRVLEMPADYSGWFVKHVINLGQSPMYVLLFAEGDKQDEEPSMVINKWNDKVVAYDLGSSDGGVYTCRAICDAAGSGSPPYAHLIDVYPCFDSLACV